MQIFSFLNTEARWLSRMRCTCLNAALAQSCPSSAIPKSAPKIASSRITAAVRCGATRETGVVKIHREFYREAVDTRANERSYFHSAISPSLSFLPSFSLLLPFAAWELYYLRPLARPFFTPRLLHEKNVQLCKNTRESFAGGARSANSVFELISGETGVERSG